MRIPRTIHAKTLTGYKGEGPVQRKVFYPMPKQLQLEELGAEKYKKGWRIYERYVDRYGLEYVRSPKGRLRIFGEQVG